MGLRGYIALLKLSKDYYAKRHPGPKEVYLIIEVSDTTLEKDQTLKLELYATAGIKEYWIVNPADKTLFIYFLRDNEFIGMHPLIAEDRIQSKLFPDLDFQLESIFG